MYVIGKKVKVTHTPETPSSPRSNTISHAIHKARLAKFAQKQPQSTDYRHRKHPHCVGGRQYNQRGSAVKSNHCNHKKCTSDPQNRVRVAGKVLEVHRRRVHIQSSIMDGMWTSRLQRNITTCRTNLQLIARRARSSSCPNQVSQTLHSTPNSRHHDRRRICRIYQVHQQCQCDH